MAEDIAQAWQADDGLQECVFSVGEASRLSLATVHEIDLNGLFALVSVCEPSGEAGSREHLESGLFGVHEFYSSSDFVWFP